MPRPIPALAIRAAALVAVLPATTMAGATAAPPTRECTRNRGCTRNRHAAGHPIGLTMPAAVPTSASASASAVALALSKVGSPYRWGAEGPSAFDCSGLVTWAFRGVGISLPRSSRAMSQVGTPVSEADLQPGDLVFFYRPVSHVGIYIGNGQMVHASSRKSPVKVSDISDRTLTAARRL